MATVHRSNLVDPVFGAVVLVGGYIAYQGFSANPTHCHYCKGLVIQMRMHKGEGKIHQLNKQFDVRSRLPIVQSLNRKIGNKHLS